MQVFAPPEAYVLEVYVLEAETERNKDVITCQGVASAMKNTKCGEETENGAGAVCRCASEETKVAVQVLPGRACPHTTVLR